MKTFLTLKWLVFHTCLAALLLSCGKEDKSEPELTVAKEATPPQKTEAAPRDPLEQYEPKVYPSAEEALKSIIQEVRPKVIGFGEFHQHENTVKTVSSLRRFTDSLLPLIAEKTSDLVVETWVSAGNCGESEKKVVKDVEEVSKRPAQTENETVELLRRAKEMKITPHILELKCEDYERVQGDAGVDYLAMLELVRERLEDKGSAILDRKKVGSGERPMLAIYCGAIHNDSKPEEIWKSVSFGPKLSELSDGKYVEIDLYVPEFIENSEIAQKEPWYPLYRRFASPKGAVLIKRSENAYVIIYRKGVAETGISAAPK